MECPNCHRELEAGTMYTEKYPYWTQQQALPVFRHPKDMVSLRPRGDDSEGSFDLIPFHGYPGTLLCRACKLVVFPYE